MDTVTIHASGAVETGATADGDANDTTTASVDIALHAGGRIRQISIAQGDEHATLLADMGDAPFTGSGWGSFVMAPWAGRLRHGRFEVDGDPVSLDVNLDDGARLGGALFDPPRAPLIAPVAPDDRRHAIHGTTFARPWTVEHLDRHSIEMICTLHDDTGEQDHTLGWPFAGVARQRIEVHVDHVTCALSIEAAPGVSFPAALGWHPWFRKPEILDFVPEAMYRRDHIGLPTGELVTPSEGPWDDCFVNHAPVRLSYDRALASTVTVTSDCDHLVVFDHPEHATCIEPQSGPPDALNLAPLIVGSTNALMRTMTIGW